MGLSSFVAAETIAMMMMMNTTGARRLEAAPRMYVHVPSLALAVCTEI